MNIGSLREVLQPPVQRSVLVKIIAEGLSSQPIAKAAVQAIMLTMPQSSLDKLALIAQEALLYVENDDKDGLHNFLEARDVPPSILEVIDAFPTDNRDRK